MGEIIFNSINFASIAFICLAILLAFPFPITIRRKISRISIKLFFPIFGLISFFLIIFLQEFFEQQKYGFRRKEAANGEKGASNLRYFASEYFRHQRNMYIALTSIACGSVFLILTRLLRSYLNEHNTLLEQLEVRNQANSLGPNIQNSSSRPRQ
ncbi:hypothetical protein TRFO_20549 [Tritrichomonas foetus]|uniref:BAP29/BAP31 transmembrane domain-containing protein n=1 Tax=Tritrichomonas foetus TaxID=1144522 RepID=A0A1J4KG37_9EUKA|nr:hypothetical protein TRFO_20549 [Tritrichomonas foetus]|eukprot:OHT10179.1 hypothetical protein TRFO_20549 [Tritrichomonas foetus]